VELSVACAACGHAGSPSARFCGKCGAPRHEEPAARAPAPSPRVGELKQATVLFADIVSSTEHIANLGPEEAMEQLQPAVARMCEVIVEYGGTVLRTLGDGVMALFGLPRSLEDHAMRACEAAMSMQEAFRLQGGDLAIRVGLHSGMVASDPESHDSMRGGGAHGVAIHIASRVVALAEPGGTCLTGDCLGLLRGGAQARSLGPRMLKGLRDPIEVHVLESLHPLVAQDQRPLGSIAFCGRDEELAVLHEALRRTLAGDTQAVGIRAAPGTGKSRLCVEFTARCRRHGLRVHQVRVQPYGHATPLQPILEILRSILFDAERDADPAGLRSHVSARLAGWPDSLPGDEDLLCDFLGIAAQREDDREVPQRRARLFDVIAGLLRYAPDEETLLLLEDLHWLDESSEAFVAGILSALQGRRTLVVLNYRPRPPAVWESLPFFRCIDLRELSRVQTEELVRGLLGHRAEYSDVSELIARRSGGNPFFAEELVRSIVQGSAFVRDGAANGPQFEFIDEALPQTVQAVIAARIDRLNAEQKQLLQICAIVGKEVPQEILEDVTRGEVENLPGALRELCRLEFLTIPGKPPHLFAFGHPLIQEVAYTTQLKARRSVIHALVAQAMARRFGERPEQAGLIGHHYEAAGHHLEAARHIVRAARWLIAADSAAASRQWQRVRALLQAQPRSLEADRLRIRACNKIAGLGWHAGCTLAEMQPYIDEAKALAAESDPRYLQLLLVIEGRLMLASGANADEYVSRMHQALQLEVHDAGRQAFLNAVLSHAYGRAGLMREALECNDRAWQGRALIDPADREDTEFEIDEWILAMRGRSLARRGRFEEAQAVWRQMLAGGPVSPVLETIAHLGTIEHAWCVGDAQLALEANLRMAQLAAQRQVPYVRALAQMCDGMSALVANDVARAMPTLLAALSLSRSHRVAIEFEPDLLAALAECALRQGDLGEARDYCTSAIRVARTRGARIAECRALIVLGMIHAAAGVGQAQDGFDAAEDLVRKTGAQDYAAVLARARRGFEPPRRAMAGG
jgi:adenylate cyclase